MTRAFIVFLTLVLFFFSPHLPLMVNGGVNSFYPTYNVTTIAGGLNGLGNGNNPLDVNLYNPHAVAIHPLTQHIYMAEAPGNSMGVLAYGSFIRKISNGVVTTFAGTGYSGSNSGDGGPAIDAVLVNPYAMAFSPTGDLYLVEMDRSRIRKIFTNGTIVTVAGLYGFDGQTGDGQLAVNAVLNRPQGIAVDTDGTVYIADTYNCVVRKIDTKGIISLFAGVYNNCGYNADYILANASYLNFPGSVAIASNGDLIIADYNSHRIRRVLKSNSTIITIAGTGTAGFSGDGGLAINAATTMPVSVTTTSKGDIYFIDSGRCVIRKISSGIITTIAGTVCASTNPIFGDYGNGGLAVNAIISPNSITANYTSGDIYMVDSFNSRVRVISYSSGIISTVAGHGGSYSGDKGLATYAQLSYPFQAVAGSSGEIYIVDTYNDRVRILYPNSTIATFAGNGTTGYSGDGGLATNAQLNSPRCVAIGSAGEVYIADSGNSRLRKVSNGIITTIAGNGAKNIVTDGTLAIQAALDVQCVAISNPITNEILIQTASNARIYKITNSGTTYAVAGTGNWGISGNNGPATSAPLTNPKSFAVSNLGDIFLAEDLKLRKVSASTGIINIIAGSDSACESPVSGVPAISACMNPSSISVSKYGDYVYFTNPNSVHVIGPDGIINTIAGSLTYAGLKGDNGLATNALFGQLHHTTFLSNTGEILISDQGNNRIRRLSPYCPNGYGLNSNFTQCVTSCYGISNELTTCSGNGACNSPNNCTCFSGYTGTNCQYAVCFGKLSNDPTVCTGRGNCSYPDTCVCTAGAYTGNQCQISACYGISSNSSSVCSGNGTCISNNNCSCSAGYYDLECQSYNCAGVKNTKGNIQIGYGCNNGTCIGPNMCSCSSGYTGSNCQFTICNGISSNNSNICNSKGQCILPDNCKCNTGWYGQNCELTQCYSYLNNDSAVCSGRGKCINPNSCSCNSGYTGLYCELAVCYGKLQNDSTVCSSSGSCLSNDNCQCTAGYRGNQCQYLQIDLDGPSAILLGAYSPLLSYAPNSIKTCQDLFSQSDILSFGDSSVFRCDFSSQGLKIYLGFNHSIVHGSILTLISNNVVLQVNALSAVSVLSTTTGSTLNSVLSPLTLNQPLIVRTTTSNLFYGFKPISLQWSCNNCPSSIQSLLLNNTNNPVVVIPSTYLNSITNMEGNSKVVSVSLTSSNSYNTYTSSRNYSIDTISNRQNFELISNLQSGGGFSCVGESCIVELFIPTTGTTLQNIFDGSLASLSDQLYGKQMFRFSNSFESLYTGALTTKIVEASQYSLKTPISYSVYDQLGLILTNIERTFSLSSNIVIGTTVFDPYLNSMPSATPLQYSWSCFNKNTNQQISSTICSSSTNTLTITAGNLPVGDYIISLSVSVSGLASQTLSGTISILNSPSSVPSIKLNTIPDVYPYGKSLSIQATVTSSSSISDLRWDLVQGRIKLFNGESSISSILQQSTTNTAFGTNVQSNLLIDTSRLIQGEKYKIQLNVTNGQGQSSANVITTIDLMPRFRCQVYDPLNLMVAYESSIVISCLKNNEKISSFIMQVNNGTSRIGILSNTPKSATVSPLPYANGGKLDVIVKLVTTTGSSAIMKYSVSVNLPSTLVNDNSYSSRFSYLSNQYQQLKSQKQISFYTASYISSLLSLFLQDTPISQLPSVLDAATSSQLVSLLVDMSSVLYQITGLGYNVPEKIMATTIPPLRTIYVMMNTLSPTSIASQSSSLSSWMTYIFSAISSSANIYSPSVLPFIIDSDHYNEIVDLFNSFSSVSSPVQFINNMASLNKFVTSQNSNSTGSTVIHTTLPQGETNMQTGLLLSQVDGKYFTMGGANFMFPSDFTTQMSALGLDNTLSYDISYSSLTSSQLIGPLIDISIQQSGNTVKVKNLSNRIVLTFNNLVYKANSTSNITCAYYDTTNNKWAYDGVTSNFELTKNDSNTLYFNIKCHTTHLTSFGVLDTQSTSTTSTTPITPTTSSTKASTDNSLGIGLGVGLSLFFVLLIAIIVVVVIVVILLRLRSKKKHMLLDQESQRLHQQSQVATATASTTINSINIEMQNYTSVDFPSASMSFAPISTASNSSNTSTDPISQRYRNLSKIGQGGFGSVFKATDSRNNHEKALKVMKFTSFEDLNSIMKEGAQLMNINHPYILKVNEFFVDNDQLLCIDMDYYEKGDLTSLIKSEGYCSEVIVRKILDQSCQALDYIHTTMSLIHRDIKPNNIFIKSMDENDIHVIVADFGLARQNQGSVNNSYAGTPMFMSPEIAVGGKYNLSTDIYSLGVTLYQIMSKDSETSISQLYMMKETEAVKEFLREKLNSSGKYSQELIELVIQMLAKDNQLRPSAKSIVEQLTKQYYVNQN